MIISFIALLGCQPSKVLEDTALDAQIVADTGDTGIVDMGAIQDERVSNIDPSTLPAGSNPCREPMLRADVESSR